MNPTVPEKVVQDAYERDAASAAAEFGAEFRTDIAGFLDRGIVDAAIDSGVQVRPPIEGVRYIAFADPSGGARDAFTVGIAHAENGTAVLDAVFERRPPFNPATVVAEIRDFLRSYRISSVVGDRYGAAWVTTAFAQVGVRTRTPAVTEAPSIWMRYPCSPAAGSGSLTTRVWLRSSQAWSAAPHPVGATG
jgi:hypothetical protein